MSEPFIGQICPFGFNFAPRGWAFCDGQLLPISSNTALFSLLGTTYGGDGRTTMGLPDLRGRAPIKFGRGPGLSDYRIGQKEGSETVTLTVQNMPSHNHAATASFTGTLKANTGNADHPSPTGNTLSQVGANKEIYNTANPNTDMHSDSVEVSGDIDIANNGGSQSHYNMQPYLAINWCIALVGLFPSRS